MAWGIWAGRKKRKRDKSRGRSDHERAQLVWMTGRLGDFMQVQKVAFKVELQIYGAWWHRIATRARREMLESSLTQTCNTRIIWRLDAEKDVLSVSAIQPCLDRGLASRLVAPPHPF